ncbi:MAG: transposon-encoded TnpW family protein [Defluviitaleaceae bacterium]|nr:transposon-encoded TnpW family protein [Defluviitaleaceae bacterium]
MNNTEDTKNTEKKPERESFGQMTKKIGNITYEVNFYFSETSKETIQDKILRLARNDTSIE